MGHFIDIEGPTVDAPPFETYSVPMCLCLNWALEHAAGASVLPTAGLHFLQPVALAPQCSAVPEAFQPTGRRSENPCVASAVKSGLIEIPPAAGRSPPWPTCWRPAVPTAPGFRPGPRGFRPPPPEDHRPVRVRRPADGRHRAGPDHRVQRPDLQLPRAARRAGRATATASSPTRDTEVLLKAFHRWGPACVERFSACSPSRCSTATPAC